VPVVTFAGLNMVTDKLTILALVAERFKNDPFVALTVVVVYVNVLAG